MKDTKTEIRFFSVPQWKKEEQYLRDRHNDGWEFTGVGFPGVYHFRKCEPKDVVYQLDYNEDSVRSRDEYIQMFSDCGWEYIQNYVGYSYFRKPVSEMKVSEEAIFCDDASRLEMIKRVFEGRMVPLLLVFFMVIIPQIFMQAEEGSSGGRGVLILFIVLFALYLAIFISFAVPFIKCSISGHRE